MTLYDILRYDIDEVTEFENLLNIVYRLGIEDEVQESFFQFSPSLIMDKDKRIHGFGEHEPWFKFHKSAILIEIIAFLIKKVIDEEYIQEDMINELVQDDKYIDFIDSSLYTMSKKDIIKKFKKYIKKERKCYLK